MRIVPVRIGTGRRRCNAPLDVIVRGNFRLLAKGRGRRIAAMYALLGCGRFVDRFDDAEIMLGMLEVVFGHDAVAGGVRITRELKVLFVDVRGRAADFDFRAVRIVGAVRIEATTPATASTAAVSVMTILRPAAASS